MYKPNPVSAISAHIVARVLAPLVDRGFLAIVGGGVAAGQLLSKHELVDRIMMTGSAATYDKIV